MPSFEKTIICNLVKNELRKIISEYIINMRRKDVMSLGIGGGHGIYIGKNVRKAVVSNNKCIGIAGSGYCIHQDADVIFDSNVAYGSGLDGLTILGDSLHTKKGMDMGNIIITGSKFDGNGRHGMNIPKDANVQISDTTASGNFKDGLHLRDYAAFEELRKLVDELQLNTNTKAELLSNVATIEEQLESSNRKTNIIEKSFSSIKTILEMVTASAIYANSPNVTTVIASFMAAMANMGFQ